jgi:RNA polymerase sigma-70 factor (ECF subfamily)
VILLSGFLQLYDQCFGDVYRFVYSRVGNQWDTDDLVSEVFTKAHRRWSTVRGDARAWLFTIARHTVTDFYRTKQREIPDQEAVEGLTAEGDDPHARTPDLDCLQAALEQLDERQREMISLRYFAGLTYRELARSLNLREGTVKVRVYRLLGKVKEMVERCLMD